ncbi:MAG: hypothetical protein K6G30_05955 [Acetatifactor sp.]|nr:hypothetical protein [Acetatifactor sp.]
MGLCVDIIAGVYLAVLGGCDIRWRKVPLHLLLAGGICTAMGIILLWNKGEYEWWWTITGVLPGVVLMVLSLLTGQVGGADGIVVFQMGAIYGLYYTVSWMWVSMLFAAGVSIVLVILGKVNRKTRMPYLAFLALSFFFMRLGGRL